MFFKAMNLNNSILENLKENTFDLFGIKGSRNYPNED